MRIAFDAVSLTRERGGTANYLARLVRRLVELDPDIQIILFSPDKICVDFEPFIHFPRVRRVVLDLPRDERALWASRHLPRLLKEHPVDIFHQPGGTDFPFFRPPCPMVVTVHDMAPWVLGGFKSWYKAVRYKVRTLLWAHQARMVLTGSEASAKDIRRFCHLPPGKVTAALYGAEKVYEGVIPQAYADDILRKYRLLGKRYVVNFSGLNRKRRNLDLVLDGFARFNREMPGDVTLVFTGTIGNAHGMFERAQRRMEMLGIRDRVVTTGYIPEKPLQVILDHAEAVVLTSFYEGFPQSLAEAFVCGAAAIATDRGGVAEVAGDAAVIIDPYDPEGLAEALKRLMGNEVERELYVNKGYARALAFSWKTTAAATLAVYRGIAP
jgi:glycosyltransferase involved in cell wall biosynthesis